MNEHSQLCVEKKSPNLIEKLKRYKIIVIIFNVQRINQKLPNNVSLTAIIKELIILIVPKDISLNAYQNLINCMMYIIRVFYMVLNVT